MEEARTSPGSFPGDAGAKPAPATMPFLDPDRRWFSADKWLHLVGAALTCAALVLVGTQPLRAFAYTVVAGAIFELGQWDALRGTEYLGRPGYGFGLLDLAADALGALVAMLALPLVLH